MKTADIHSQLQALISSCIDEGDYDPAEDYIKDPFCRRTMHTASLAINEIDTLRARVAELEGQHKGLVIQNATLRQRPDLPADRIPAANRVAELEAERGRWKAEALAWRKRAKYDGSKGEFNAIKMSDAEALVAWLRATNNLPKG